MFPLTWRRFLNTLSPKARGKAPRVKRKAPAKPSRPLYLEHLEDRLVPSISYQVPGSTLGNQAFGGPLGMDFDVNQPVVLTQLGVFDSGSDGLQSPLSVTLYDRDTQTPVDQIEFAAGNAGTLVGGSRFLPLATPVILPAGFHGTIVAEGYGAAEPDGNQGVSPIPGVTTDTGGGLISFVGGGRFGFTPNTFPTNVDGGPANRYLAGTFQFFGVNTANTFVNDNWNLVQDNGDGVLSVGDRVSNGNDTINPGTITATYGVDAFGTVTTSSVPGENLGTGSVAGAATIHDAVALTTPGGTLTVLEGTYTDAGGPIVIDKSVTLLGAQHGVDAQNGRPGAAESILNNSQGVDVTASGVTIDGFTVQNSTNNAFTGFGIDLGAGTSGSHVVNNIIQNNIAGLGLANNSATSQTVISGNLFKNNDQPGPVQGSGIYTDQFVGGSTITNVLIDNNTFTDNTPNANAAVNIAGEGNSQSNITVSNNLITDMGNGVLFFNTTGSSATFNTITGSLGSQVGIFDGSNGITIAHNIIDNGYTRGVRIDNTIGNGGTNSNVTVNDNHISGNATAGLEIDNDSGPGYSGTLDATNNYWGSPTGPTTPNNPGGTGDKIIDPNNQLIFSPFLTSGTNTATGRGFSPGPNPPIGITVDGTSGADTLVVTAAGPNSGTYSLNGGPAVPFSNATRFTFNGNGGADTFTVNNPSGGLFAPSDGVFYIDNGGGSLQILGGQAVTETFNFAPNTAAGHNGSIVLVKGTTTANYSYSGLSPVLVNLGTAPTTAVFNLPADGQDNKATLEDNGTGGDGISQIRSQNNTFETTQFTDPTSSLTVNVTETNPAGESLTLAPLDSTFSAPTITYNGGPGDDFFTVLANPSGTTTTFNTSTDGAAGPDTAFIGGSPSTHENLDNVLGNIVVNGQSGNTVLNVNDQESTSANTYTLTSSTVQRIGAALVTYSNVQTVNLNGGSGGNTFTVTGTSAATNTVNSGSGNDKINIQAVASGTTLNANAQAGTDTINVSSNAPTNTGTLTSIAGTLTVDSGDVGGSDVLNVSETGETTADTVTVDTANFANPEIAGSLGWRVGFTNNPTRFSGGINVSLGSGGNTVNVLSVDTPEPVTVDAGSGDDTVNVSDVNNTLDRFSIGLTVNGQGGTNTLNVNDQGSTVAHTYTVTGTTVDRDSGSPTITYSGIQNLALNGGSADETYNVQSPGVTTTVNAGPGDDTFNVTPNINSPSATITVNGGPPTTPPGDALNVNVAGTTDPTLNITSNSPPGSLSGNYTFTNAGTLFFTSIESLSPTTADLGVTKADSPDPVLAGDDITYTITVTNGGPLASQNVQLTDATPTNTTFVSFTVPSGWTAGPGNPTAGGTGQVTATDPNLAPGATSVFTLVVHVNPSTPNSTVITNTANVNSSTTQDANSLNNQANATTTVNTSADLAVTKTDSAGTGTVTAGALITYTVSLTNNGPSDAQGVVLTDTLSANETFQSSSDSGGGTFTPNTTGNTTTFTATGPFAAGATHTFLVVARVNSNTANASTASDTASVATTGPNATPDPYAGNNSATVSNTVVTSADLVVTKTDSPDPVVAGQSLSYTIAVSNSGPSDAQNVTLVDNFPPGLSFQGATPSQGSGTLSGSLLDFNFGTIASGATATLTIFFGVSANTANGTVLTNQATATSNTADPNNNNNTGTAMTTVTNQADLVVTKMGPASATPGTDITYTVTLSNAGPNTAQGVTLTDAVPANTTFVSAAPVAGQNPDGFSYSQSGGTVIGTPTGGVVAAGNTDEFVMVVTVNSGTPANTTISNSATASMNSTVVTDPNAANNTGTATTTTSAPSADVVTTKNGPATVNAGEQITYTVTVADNGPSDATIVQFTDTVPANTSFVSVQSSQGSLTQLGGVISGNLGTITTAAPVTITIVVGTSPSVADGTQVTNAATAFGGTADPNTANNTGTATTTVHTSADLGVTKTTTDTTPTPGTLVTYTVSVTDAGPSDAQSVALTDDTPPFTTFFSQSQTSGPAFTPSDPGQGNPGTISDTIATLHAGESATFLFVFMVNSSTPINTSITNTATIASPTPDANTGNNNSSATVIAANASADLVVTKNSPATAVAGTDYTFTITVSNSGPSDAANVTVTDQLPSQVTFRSASSGGVNGTGLYTANFGTIAAGGSATVVVTVLVAPGAPNGSSINNSANGQSTVADPNLSNNTSSTSTTVQTIADLSASKTGPANVTAGTDATYTITVSNGGPSDAQNVIFTDSIPTGTTFVSETQTAGAVTFAFPNNPLPGSSSGTVFGQAQTLAAGQSATFVLVFHASPSDLDGSTVSNTAVVSSSTTDSNGNNNSSTVNTTVNTSADLQLTKTGTPTADAGTQVTYTLSVTNVGPSDAQNVMVNDTLPAGETFVSASTGTGTGTSYSSGNLGALAAGGSETITIVAMISPSQPASTVTDTATVSSSTSDPNATNNTATFDTTVTTSADVVVIKTGPATVTAGTDITYTITTSNAGPSDALGVQTTDSPPPNTSLVSFMQDSGPTDGSTLPAGMTETFTLVLHLNANQADGTTITNRADAASTGGTPDPNGVNNTSTFDSKVVAVADLVLTKNGPTTATAGTQLTYTLTLTNNGPSDAQSVTISDTLPAGESFVSSSEGGATGNAFTDNIGTFAFGASRTITIVALVGPSVSNGSTLQNTATVTTTTTDDSATDNDETSSVNTVVLTSADLQISKSGPATITAGTDATYTITLTNAGPSDAQSVSVTDGVPAGTTFVSATPVAGQNPDGFSYVQSGGTVTGTPTGGVVAAGHQDEFVLVVHALSSDAPGSSITNTASVSTGTSDPNTSNNSATVNGTVTTVADLQVIKSGPATITAGTDATYTITLTNAGPSDALNVNLTDDVPAGTTFVSISPVIGFTRTDTVAAGGTGTITEQNASFAAGSTASFALVVFAKANDPDGSTITNTANVATSTPDDSSANDETSTVTSNVVAVADLVLTQSGPATVTAGTDITYTITLSNNGPSDAQTVSVTDGVPNGTTFVSATPVGGQNPDGFSYSQAGGIVTGTPTGGVVPAGHNDEFTLVVHLLSGAVKGSSVSNQANVTSTTTDDNEAINDEQATVTSNVTTSADLALTNSGPALTAQFDLITYTIAVTNAGPSDAQGVVVTDTLSPGLAFVSATGGGTASGNTVTFNVGTLTLGAGTTLTLTARATQTGSQSTSAVVSTTSGDPNSANNSQAITTFVAGPAAPPASAAAFPVGQGDNGQALILSLAARQERSVLTPFPGFPGEIHTATYLRNGDPIYVLAAGAGGAPQVNVVNGATGQILGAFYAFDTAFRGGTYVAAADINGDGVPDIIVGAGAGGASAVEVVDGTKINQVVPAGQPNAGLILPTSLLAAFTVFPPDWHGGVTVAAGDVNADGVPDIVVGAGAGGAPTVNVIDGTKLHQVQGSGQIDPSALLGAFYAFPLNFHGGVFVAAGDVNGDFHNDVIVGAGAGGDPAVMVVDGTKMNQVVPLGQPNEGQITGAALLQAFSAFDHNFQGGVRVAAIDYLARGRADIMAAQGPGGNELRILDATDLAVLDDIFAGDMSGLFV